MSDRPAEEWRTPEHPSPPPPLPPAAAVRLVVVVRLGATALAFALGAGPTPAAQAARRRPIHDALGGAGPVQGVSANITADRTTCSKAPASRAAAAAGGGGLTSSPLFTGASGRLWVAKDGRVRLELQSRRGDTQVLYDGHTLSLYDAATNTLYRYTPPAGEPAKRLRLRRRAPARPPRSPVAHPDRRSDRRTCSKHADVSGADADRRRRPAGLHGARLAEGKRQPVRRRGALLRRRQRHPAAGRRLLDRPSTSPVIELAATEVSYGPVARLGLRVTPPANAKVEEVKPARRRSTRTHSTPARGGGRTSPSITTHGHGPRRRSPCSKAKAKARRAQSVRANALEGLPKVNINGTSASELRTELGTLLSSSAPACATCSPAPSPPRRSKPSRVASSVRDERAARQGAAGWSSATRTSSPSTTST